VAALLHGNWVSMFCCVIIRYVGHVQGLLTWASSSDHSPPTHAIPSHHPLACLSAASASASRSSPIPSFLPFLWFWRCHLASHSLTDTPTYSLGLFLNLCPTMWWGVHAE
jgi:hypothetical protein